jgi:hypothetical protein
MAGQADVKFTQLTDGGTTWSTPAVVNDNIDGAGPSTDQFQPSIAAGPRQRGGGRVLRPPPSLPEGSDRPARRRRTDELLHGHLIAGVQGQRQRGCGGRVERCECRSSWSAGTHRARSRMLPGLGP